jgi:hypothetical protein
MSRRLFVSAVLAAFIGACAGGGNAGRAAAAPAAALPCNNAQFLSDRAAFVAGTMSADQFVDVCGTVTAVRRAARTRSGTHGYFDVTLAGPSSVGIEIVANLDAMAQAATGAPPAWPWVAAGQYVYVQGRYYFDRPGREGIDWTEDDSSRSWPHVGYVAVCDPGGTACTKYW